MIIQKQYKFYAAHRNEELRDKCSNIHGHRYGLTCFFEVERTGHLTTLFSDFDALIDPLYETFEMHADRTGERFRLKVLDFPTSVENVSYVLFTEIVELGFRLKRIELRETDTSVVEYTREDWVADNRRFSDLSLKNSGEQPQHAESTSPGSPSV